MKTTLFALIALLLCTAVMRVQAQTQPAPPANAQSMPGKDIAQTVSLITGVAVSPLLGVSAVGAWKYFDAKTPEQKAALPWFANPLFWTPALLVVGMCVFKDTAGTMIPAGLKKPFDVADAVENKVSGVVATGAFVPIAASIFSAKTGTGDGAMLSLSQLGFASIDLSWLYNIVMVPFAMIAFFIVFLASNAINVLILLSPSSWLDAALKSFRAALLASVVGTSFANPWVGALWAVIIILICWLIAGWSFRLSCFGTVFIWDFVTGRRRRFKPAPTDNKVFLGRKINKVPIRTYGRLSRDDKGNLVLKYRPWLVLSQREMTLPEGKYVAGKGVFFSEIQRLDGEKAKTAILLPPRYLGHEDELVGIYGLTGVRDIGLRAAWAWLKGLLGFGEKVQTQAA